MSKWLSSSFAQTEVLVDANRRLKGADPVEASIIIAEAGLECDRIVRATWKPRPRWWRRWLRGSRS